MSCQGRDCVVTLQNKPESTILKRTGDQVGGNDLIHIVLAITFSCRGWYGTSWVAVKTVHTSGHDMTECEAAEVSVCYRRCAAKLLQEVRMLHKLAHPNVIKVITEI